MRALTAMTGKSKKTIELIEAIHTLGTKPLFVMWWVVSLITMLLALNVTDSVAVGLLYGVLFTFITILSSAIVVMICVMDAMAEHIVVIETSLRAGAEAAAAIDKAKRGL